MSRVYDNWEKLVGAVLKREELKRLALCESFSSSISADFSSRFNLDSSREDVPFDSRNSSETTDPAAPSTRSILSSHSIMAIEFEELRKATRNFRPQKGVPVLAFKGWIDEHYLTATKPGTGVTIFVKYLRDDSLQGHREWLNEINYLSQLHHPNLVKLIGYCFKEDIRFLVYEFMHKGSLDNHLFGGYLSWPTRINVAIDAARGLSFLHGLAVPVIHRHFHSGNILLDGEYKAKLDDFGLADSTTHASTRVMGRYGYAALEYEATGHLTTRCDVYSFGVVLLEILSGRRAIDLNPAMEEQKLVEWAKSCRGDKRKLMRIMDKNLNGQYHRNEAHKVALLALQCLSSQPKKRPRMAEVLAALEQLSHSKAT